MDAGPAGPTVPDGEDRAPAPRIARFDGLEPATAPDRVADLSSAGAGATGHAVARLDHLGTEDPTGGPRTAPIPVDALPTGLRADAP
ncbi:MAG TPA: hypothetical protein VEZ42_01905, partial [Pseudonocardia sp.]|nr:hypothetical protein [Pseudonocardia sp.]